MKNVFLPSMRWIVFFISFLVLSLSSIPCCLMEDIGENSLCMETHSETEDDHTGDEPCSPFLNCGTCTGFAIQQHLEVTFLGDELAEPEITSYQHLFKSPYQNPEFKPPKS